MLFNYRSNLEELCKDYRTKNIYLSPEEIESLERADKTANHGWLANSFSFGMIMLSLMCMKHMNEVYDYRSCEINHRTIEELLKVCSNKFSYRLINIVESMLRRKSSERLSFRNLLIKLDEKIEIEQPVELTLVDQKSAP